MRWQTEVAPSLLGHGVEGRPEAGAEVARTVKEQLEELRRLLDAWSDRLAQRLDQAPPAPGTPQGVSSRPVAWSWGDSDKGPQPAPPKRLSREPMPPIDVVPPWQAHTGGSDSEVVMPAVGPQRSETGKPSDQPDIPGAIDSLRASSSAKLASPGVASKQLGAGFGPRSQGRADSKDSVNSRRPELADDKKLMEISGGIHAQKGRTMMQLYDLTNKFDMKAINTLHMQQTGALVDCVQSKAFTVLSACLIFLNAILIGVQMNSDVTNAIAGLPDAHQRTWFALEIAFTVVFSLELMLRALSEGRLFFLGSERKWNMLDLALILLSLVDLIMTEASTMMPNVSFARTLRVLRFTRILRVVRVMRFFQSFRLMMVSIVNSLTNLLWVFLLLSFVMYFFASIFVHGVTEHFRQGGTSAFDDAFKLFFGNVSNALVALFGAICGGMDWLDLYLPLLDLGWFYACTFVSYVFFVMFGVLNVVVGTFVDSAYQASQRDREYVVQCEVNRNKKYMEDIKTFFHEADSDRSGMLTLEEFETHLKKDKVKAYFQALELDISQARALFLLLDVDGSNEIELDEFIGGCMRMKGDAKSIDVNMLLYENEKMIAKWTAFMDYCTDRFDGLEAALVPEALRLPRLPLGQSPAEDGQPPAEGGLSPAVGGLSPAEGSQLMLRGTSSVSSPVSKTSTRTHHRRLAATLAVLSQPPPSPAASDSSRFRALSA